MVQLVMQINFINVLCQKNNVKTTINTENYELKWTGLGKEYAIDKN